MICIMRVRPTPFYVLHEWQIFDYVLGEGHFDDISAKPSGAATPVSGEVIPPSSSLGNKKRSKTAKGPSKRAKTTKERLRLIDGDNDPIDE